MCEAGATTDRARGVLLRPFDLSRSGGRLRAYLSFLWDDHAYLRLGFQNAHWVSPELVRTNQPWPFQLKWWKRRGIRTVLNLRDKPQRADFVLEKDACERLGLNFVNFVVASREAPTREQVLSARRLFETIEYPCLMHCKSGADRVGVMSVLYAHFRLGLPMREAARQLSFRYGHIRHGDTGVLDFVFERYLEEADESGESFEDWVSRPDYDRAEVKAAFSANWWGRALTEKLLRRE
jgi:protein tyrosine/serine phosphatase